MNQPSPQEQMSRLLCGAWITQSICAAAKLGVADLLHARPQTSAELAAATGSHPHSLYRLLRALASFGIFAEDAEHRFALTPLAECLRDVPGSQRSFAIMVGGEQYQAWGGLLYSVQTGKSAFERIFGQRLFEYLQDRPDQARTFDEAMFGVHGRETAAMLDAYDFSDIGVLADIGGGNASLLTGVLCKYPQMRGILCDLPGVVERAQANLATAGLADRCQFVAGSFFDAVPSGADAYLLRHIIHDWTDEEASDILQNIHDAMGEGGKLLVVESVIPPGNEPFFGKLLDLTMLVVPGGRERTKDEYRQLFAAGGFRLTRIVPTAAEVCVIEGKKA